MPLGLACLAAVAIALSSLIPFHASWSGGQEDIHVGKFSLPRYSEYLSTETRAGFERAAALYARATQLCNPTTQSTSKDIRACEARMYPPVLAEARKLYDVKITTRTIAGVHTDVVVPTDGVAPQNRHRVLINAHGGGFRYGAQFGVQLEAMPIAAIGKYQVIAVD